MKGLVLLLSLISLAAANYEDSCNAHVVDACQEPGSDWSEGPCNAIYGGFRGNTNNLHQLMASSFQDSFKMMFMGSHFNSDEVNRMGMHKLLQDHSDKMWENGKSLMKYIVHRGGKMGDRFKASELELNNVHGEVEAIGAALDMIKKQANNVLIAHKHSMNKKDHENKKQDSYDPDVAHFLQDELLEGYTSDIRTLAGHLNVLAKMARKDNTRAMGLHLFDEHLLN